VRKKGFAEQVPGVHENRQRKSHSKSDRQGNHHKFEDFDNRGRRFRIFEQQPSPILKANKRIRVWLSKIETEQAKPK
jgi:hypothetical protein